MYNIKCVLFWTTVSECNSSAGARQARDLTGAAAAASLGAAPRLLTIRSQLIMFGIIHLEQRGG